jgi:putative toxin-antitoxin system antitoxin component (TIGR02293 family)
MSTKPAPRLLETLGLTLANIEAGVPVDTLFAFSAVSGIELKDVHAIVIPLRRLRYRQSHKQSLSCDESDKLARLVRTFDHSIRVFGSVDKAKRWLTRPKRQFGDRTPLDLLRTDAGGHLIQEAMWQIAEGFFA